MQLQINQIAVIGSGVMGSQIAALFANAGISVKLYDIVPESSTVHDRNILAKQAISKLQTNKPNAFTTPKQAALVMPCNLEDHLKELSTCDWIIEAIVENLAVKQQLFQTIDRFRRADSIVSSNTSGISIEKMMANCSENFQENFLGTHFFNPPRYLKLLEIIPSSKTNQQLVLQVKQFSEDVLGKGVVIAKDTPNFIANRIGTYGLMVSLREMTKQGLTIGEVDALTGLLIGRPKSATFRTLDVVGLDTFSHVVSNMRENLSSSDRDIFVLPEFVETMIGKGMLGSKTQAGFYLKQDDKILELQPEKLQYASLEKRVAPSVERSKQEEKFDRKIQTLIYAQDYAGVFLWSTLSEMLLYSAQLVAENIDEEKAEQTNHPTPIADHIVAIDQAMKWGYGWEYGPFELWDAIGVEQSVNQLKKEGKEVPVWIDTMLSLDYCCFYQENQFYHHGKYEDLPANDKVIDIDHLKKTKPIVRKNSSATLIELEQGILLLETHAANNAIGLELMEMMIKSIDILEQNSQYQGLLIASQGKNFCVGANLALILMEAQDDNLFEIDLTIRKFQKATQKIKFSKKPVVVMPYQMTLGGGAEICLPASRIQATTETYIGLVETGVGLIPGGGGCKELYLRYLESMPKGVQYDLQSIANRVFELIAKATVSSSADEAIENLFIRNCDGVSCNPDYQLYDAKQLLQQLINYHYQPPVKRMVPVVGETGYATLLAYAEGMKASGFISEHDLLITKKLAYVISGGAVPYGTEVTEQYLLDLERQAFLELVTHNKTQERMAYMLSKRKPLRN